MKVNVTKENVVITECSNINEGEVCINECYFYLPECFEGLCVTAAFNNIPVPVFNNKCIIPSLKKGTAVLGVYAYKENDDGVELMYSPKPTTFFVNAGSYSAEVEVEDVPTISEFEQFCKNYAKEILEEIKESDSDVQIPENIEFVDNKVTIIDENSVDEKYPSAKAVYNFVCNKTNGIFVSGNPKVWLLEEGCHYVSGFVSIDSEVGFYVNNKTLLHVSKDLNDEDKKMFVLYLACANDIPYDIITGTTDGITSEWCGIETEKNKVEKIDDTSTHDEYPSAKAVYDLFSDFVPTVGENSGGGLNSTAISLLIQILQEALYSTNVSGKIGQLQTALAQGSSSGGGSGGIDTPTTTDDITVADGVMTIISVSAEISVTDGVMTIL